MRFSERPQQLFWHRTRASVGAKAKTVEQNIPTVERESESVRELCRNLSCVLSNVELMLPLLSLLLLRLGLAPSTQAERG